MQDERPRPDFFRRFFRDAKACVTAWALTVARFHVALKFLNSIWMPFIQVGDTVLRFKPANGLGAVATMYDRIRLRKPPGQLVTSSARQLRGPNLARRLTTQVGCGAAVV